MQTIALILSMSFAIFVCYLFVQKRFGPMPFGFLILVAVSVGWLIANYDNVISLYLLGQLKIQAKEITGNTIDEIRAEIEREKASLAAESKKAQTEFDQLLWELGEQKALLASKSQEAAKALSDLQTAEKFDSTFVAAQGDDRGAFEQLKSWAADANYSYSTRAAVAYNAIVMAHSNQIATVWNLPWKPGIDPSKFDLANLKAQYNDQPLSGGVKAALIVYIASRLDIPLRQRDQFLVDVMRNDSSLLAVEYAARSFVQINKLPAVAPLPQSPPLRTDPLVEWWEQNKDKV